MGLRSKDYDFYYKLIQGIEIYNVAQKTLGEFMKVYLKNHEKCWRFTLPPLQYLVDAAPLVYDLKEIRNL